jgi:hypothetical protein
MDLDFFLALFEELGFLMYTALIIWILIPFLISVLVLKIIFKVTKNDNKFIKSLLLNFFIFPIYYALFIFDGIEIWWILSSNDIIWIITLLLMMYLLKNYFGTVAVELSYSKALDIALIHYLVSLFLITSYLFSSVYFLEYII